MKSPKQKNSSSNKKMINQKNRPKSISRFKLDKIITNLKMRQGRLSMPKKKTQRKKKSLKLMSKRKNPLKPIIKVKRLQTSL